MVGKRCPMTDALSLADPYTVPTRHWHALPDGRIQCDVCPRACRLREGQRGLCFVRGRVDDQIVLTSVRALLGVLRRPGGEEAAQPLPARLGGALLRHRGLQPGLPVLPELGHLQVPRDRHAVARPRRRRRWPPTAARLGCRVVAFTYNDPVIFMEYAMDVADACRERGIKAVAVSAGLHEPRAAGRVLPPHGRRQHRPQGVHRRVLREGHASAKLRRGAGDAGYLRHETDVWFEITTLLIPGHNDSDAEIAEECAWLAEHLGPDVPLHFTAFHPDFKMRDVPPTPPATLTPGPPDRARRTGCATSTPATCTTPTGRPRVPRLRRGRWSCATGTSCSRTGSTDGGACVDCGRRCPGVYDGPVGTWGARRLPVHGLGPGGPAADGGGRPRPAVAGSFYPADPRARWPRWWTACSTTVPPRPAAPDGRDGVSSCRMPATSTPARPRPTSYARLRGRPIERGSSSSDRPTSCRCGAARCRRRRRGSPRSARWRSTRTAAPHWRGRSGHSGRRAAPAEHSLEVQLPFLQRVLGEVTGAADRGRACPTVEAVAAVIAAAARRPTPVPWSLCSTDLSHYLDDAARAPPGRGDRAGGARRWRRTGSALRDACGVYALRGLLGWARASVASRRTCCTGARRRTGHGDRVPGRSATTPALALCGS